MSKTLTKETTFRNRVASYSTHGSKRGVNLLGWDKANTEWLTVRQERDALRARVKQMHEIFRAGGLSKAEHARLSKEFNELCAQINALHPRLKTLTEGTPIQRAMLNVLKERVDARLWYECYEEAIRQIDQVMQEAA